MRHAKNQGNTTQNQKRRIIERIVILFLREQKCSKMLQVLWSTTTPQGHYDVGRHQEITHRTLKTPVCSTPMPQRWLWIKDLEIGEITESEPTWLFSGVSSVDFTELFIQQSLCIYWLSSMWQVLWLALFRVKTWSSHNPVLTVL